jgi:hypothetical protein
LVLPANALLSEPERAVVRGHIAELLPLLAATPAQDRNAAKQTLALVTKMMLALPARKMDEKGTTATGEAYTIALDDVPTWGVAAALRRWYRGECGPEYDCAWRPAMADLRKLSLTSIAQIKWRMVQLNRLLNAQPRVDLPEPHCADMRERLGTVMAQASVPMMDKAPVPTWYGDGKHAQRVEAELAARRAARLQDA